MDAVDASAKRAFRVSRSSARTFPTRPFGHRRWGRRFSGSAFGTDANGRRDARARGRAFAERGAGSRPTSCRERRCVGSERAVPVIEARAFRDAPCRSTHRSRRTRRTTTACRRWASPRTGRTSDTARGLASTTRTSFRSHSNVDTKRAGLDYPPMSRAGLLCPGGARGSVKTNSRTVVKWTHGRTVCDARFFPSEQWKLSRVERSRREYQRSTRGRARPRGASDTAAPGSASSVPTRDR